MPDDDVKDPKATPPKAGPEIQPEVKTEPPKAEVKQPDAAAEASAAKLAEAERKAKEAIAAQQKAEQERAKLQEKVDLAERQKLEEEGKFKELAESERKRAETAQLEATTVKSKANDAVITAELRTALVLAGVNDPDVHTLVEREGISFDESGAIVGIAEAVAKFKEKKPVHFGAPRGENTSNDGRSPKPAPTDAKPSHTLAVSRANMPDPKAYDEAKRTALRSFAGGRK